MEEAPVRLFAAGTAGPLSEEELFYEIKPGQEAFLRIEAGSRVFESEAWKEEDKTEVSILPPRVLVLELVDDASEAEHEFEAAASPKKNQYRVEFRRRRPCCGGLKGRARTPSDPPVPKPGILQPVVRVIDGRAGPRGGSHLRNGAQGEKRHFFENRTFWMTGSPLGTTRRRICHRSSVLSPSISGVDGKSIGEPEGNSPAYRGCGESGD